CWPTPTAATSSPTTTTSSCGWPRNPGMPGSSSSPAVPPRPLTGHTRLAAVIGSPIRHSLSPTIYNAAFEACGLDWAFVAFEVTAGAVPAALEGVRALGIAGLSVTMPCKEAVATAVDRCDATAARLGAVNCVHRVDDGLVGR